MKIKKGLKILIITLLVIALAFGLFKFESVSNAEDTDNIEFSVEVNKEKSSPCTQSQGYDVYKPESKVAVDVWLNTPNAKLTYCDIDGYSSGLDEEENEKVEINPELSSLSKYITTDNGKFIFDSEKSGEKVYLTSNSRIKLATFYFKLSEFSTIKKYTEYNPNTFGAYINTKRDGVTLHNFEKTYKLAISEVPESVECGIAGNKDLVVGNVAELKPIVHSSYIDGEETFDETDSTCQKVIVEPENSSIVKVFYEGDTVKIKAMAEGTTNLKVSSALDPSKSCTLPVTVNNPSQTAVADFTIKNPIEKLHIYDTHKLNIEINPIDAKNADIIYQSSDPSVATIDNNGNINALKTGKTTITVYCGNISKTMDLEVINEVKSIKILNPLSYGNGGATYYVKCKVEPENEAKYVKLKFSGDRITSPSDIKQYTSDSYSVFKEGRVKVTAYVGDIEDSYYIDIEPQLSVYETQGVRINNKQENLETNKTYKLDATVLPVKAQNNKISYSSSNSEVATIDEKGVITTIAPGTTTITASTSTSTGVATDSYELTVHSTAIPLTKIELQEKSAVLKASRGSETDANKKKIYINYNPDNTTMSKDITCESENTNIANVTAGNDSAGHYIEVNAGSTIGTTTITIKSAEDDALQDTLTVRTYGVDFKEHYAYLSVGEKFTPEYIADFVDESEKVTSAKYSIANSRLLDYNTTGKVISLDDENTGTITALDNGTATVQLTVITNKGNLYTSSYYVTSKVKVDKVIIDKDVIEVPVGSKSNEWGYNVSVEPQNAFDRYTTISSSNENVVGFDKSKNYLVALHPGEATVTVKSNSSDDAYDTMQVKVVNTMHEDRTVVEAEPSTCVKNGHGKYEICNACGEIVSGSNELLPLDPNNHVNTELRNAKAATLSEDGYSGDLYCKDCGALLEKGHVIEKPNNIIELIKTGENRSLNAIKLLVAVLAAVAVALTVTIKKLKKNGK